MGETAGSPVRSYCVGSATVIHAGDYLNKLTGERIERECRRQLDSGCRGLVINFVDTELVNSIGISILLGIINVAGKNGARVIFSNLNSHTIQLLEILGLTRHVTLASNEEEALFRLSAFASQVETSNHPSSSSWTPLHEN
jgi:anti-anti-sigma factor